MVSVGLLVAVEIEAVLTRYQNHLQRIQKDGFTVYVLEQKNYRLHFIHSGMGLIKAAAATQMLCDQFHVKAIINFGVVGSLTEKLRPADTCFVSKVIHYDMDTSQLDHSQVGQYGGYPDAYLPTTDSLRKRAQALYPNLPVVICASADKFVEGAEKKAALHQKFGADICDMESAAVVLICDLHKIPNLIIKTVSDSSTGGSKEYHQQEKQTAKICMQMVEKVIAAEIL